MISATKIDTPCIEWQQGREKTGYGFSWYQRKKIAAHRKAWILEKGAIPNGLFVLHRCDNPPCVNVEHLFLGTHGDNMRDRFAKGRGRLDGKRWRGYACKVSEDDIPKIRAMKGIVTQAELGRQYGVCASAISLIQSRKNWGDVR